MKTFINTVVGAILATIAILIVLALIFFPNSILTTVVTYITLIAALVFIGCLVWYLYTTLKNKTTK